MHQLRRLVLQRTIGSEWIPRYQMGFSVGSPHGCCGLRADSWEALKCVSRCGLKGAERRGPRTRVVCCYVNSRGGHALRDGVRVPGRELHGAVALIRSAGRRGGALRADAAAKGRDGWSQISLDDVCRRLHLCFFEVCDLLQIRNASSQ
jgi:hypothetical protein